MSRSEVRSLLGEPDEIDGQTWTYARDFDIGWVNVFFDERNLLTGTDPEPAEFYYSYP